MTTDKALEHRDSRLPARSTAAVETGEQLRNISRTGALIITDHPRPVGTMIDFKFPLEGVDLVLEGTGEVTRVQDDPWGMAIRFIVLTDESYRSLQQHLEHHDATTS